MNKDFSIMVNSEQCLLTYLLVRVTLYSMCLLYILPRCIML